MKRKAAAVSIDPELFARARERAHSLGFPTFSAYVVQLLREDLRTRGSLTLSEDPGPPPPPAKNTP